MSAVAAVEVPRGTSRLEDIDLELIDVGANVRVDPGELEELAASIAELGVLQPVKVTPTADGRYRLLWGQRRVLASRQAGKATIPAIVDVDDDQLADPGARRSIEQLAENLQRKDLNAIEEAVALREVLDADPSLTQAELAKRLGRSAPWVSNALRLLALAEPVQEKVRAGEISASHGKAMASLPEKQQRELAERVVRDSLASHQLEREIQWKQDSAKQEEVKAAKTAKWMPKAIAALEADEVPKDAGVQVTGPYYDTDIEAIRRAVKKAGWRLHEGGAYGYGSSKLPEGCDCTVVDLQVGGRKAEIQRRCVERRHIDRQVNLDHVASKEQQERRDRQLQVIRDAIAREVRAAGIHQRIVELIAHAASNYGNQVRDIGDPYDALARNVVTDWRFREIDVPALLAELGLQDPEAPIEAPKPSKAKVAKGGNAPAFTPAQLAAARAELDLDGAD